MTRCANPVAKIVNAILTTTWGEVDYGNSSVDSSSDSDIDAFRARKPSVLIYSDDDDE